MKYCLMILLLFLSFGHNLRAQNETNRDYIESLEKKVDSLQQVLLQYQNQALRDSNVVIYRVQIGSFEYNADYLQYSNVENRFIIEDNGNRQKLMIGKFVDYQSAAKFREFLKQNGIKDAWVVSFLNGKRLKGKASGGS